MTAELTQDDIDAFHRDGYLVRRGFYADAEMAALSDALANDAAIRRRAYGVDDGQGGATEIALWNSPGHDSFGALARGARLVAAVGRLLGDEVYHYHSKITSKRPGAGGTWVWHQDYGYWYQNGCLYPDLVTVAIPLDPMTTANGCLHVLRGSHRMGRIAHGVVGAQTGADPERVAAACARLELVPFEGRPGDVMFFHANTLHTSAPNGSDTHRNLLLVAFNARGNDPVREHHHPRYAPIRVLDDGEIVRRRGRYDGENRVFLHPADDHSVPTGDPARAG